MKYHFWGNWWGVAVFVLDLRQLHRPARSHCWSECLDVGITISRRPKRYASIENAPGPRSVIAAAITIICRSASLPSKRFPDGAAIHKNAFPIAAIPAKALPSGDRKPMSRNIPPIMNRVHESVVAMVDLAPPERYKTPSTNDAAPTVILNNSKATPGQPAGNVGNSLCSALTLEVCEPQTCQITQEAPRRETQYVGIFRCHF